MYHPSCYEENVAPRCAVCGHLLEGGFLVHEGKNYHEKCYRERVAQRCSLCGAVIEGSYLKDFWGNAYHASHQDAAPRCDYCGRFISEKLTGGGVRYGDGRRVCGVCREGAVADEASARALMLDVAGRLAALGLEVDAAPVRLHLVARDEMALRSGDPSPRRTGYTNYRWLEIQDEDGRRQERAAHVYVLAGMPRLETIATLAHELTHVWRLERTREPIDEPLDEGACNYAAYLVLKERPGPAADFILHSMQENPDPAYGAGFRRALRYAEEKGAAALWTLLRTARRFPEGY
jgi:hypothetical protein